MELESDQDCKLLVQGHKYALLAFWAPWDRHSRELRTEIDAAIARDPALTSLVRTTEVDRDAILPWLGTCGVGSYTDLRRAVKPFVI
jgi:hypothetical protein